MIFTISGITIKHFAYCPQIVRLESLGFSERVTEAMKEGEVVEEEKVVNFLYATLKPLNIVKKPIFKYKDLVGSPDYLLTFINYVVPLDVKSGRKRNDHILQMKYYLYLLDLKGFRVKEGLIYYVSLKEILRVRYSFHDRKYIEDIVRKIKDAMKGKVKVVQDARKCYNCGFFSVCKPLIRGNIAVINYGVT
ncbi:CRISPR-associated protein Cas4 [Sulfurisphaera javensis]|uniref:CRISPR-associated exonuclease Cas4 n=1 Tax=Sulfurisphaera javensis TaxID=2049879 RepID=A0AAT9GV13_9CREN